MYLPACATLLAIGVILNFLDLRMLVLTIAVGLNIFLPVPSGSQLEFYFCCVLYEMALGTIAWWTRKEAGFLIANACAVLVVAHLMGYALDGSASLSPYHAIVKLLETLELVICIALSPVVAPILRNQDATKR